MVRLAEEPDGGHKNRLQCSVSRSTMPSAVPTAKSQKVPIKHCLQPHNKAKGSQGSQPSRGAGKGFALKEAAPGDCYQYFPFKKPSNCPDGSDPYQLNSLPAIRLMKGSEGDLR